MYHLAFESSCDDTSIALFENERLLCMKTHTQSDHEETSGVVPEIAARLHANHIFGLLDSILGETEISLEDIGAYSCTSEPGLIPSLLVGKTVSKMLSQMYDRPLFWINHIEAHVFSVFLDRSVDQIQFPAVVLSASGGHNDLFLWGSLDDLEKIGGTRDDSAGESMDKVGREMGLPFPSGKYMDDAANNYAERGGSYRGIFPIPLLGKESLDFSFSGLKSAAIREIRDRGMISDADIGEICFEYRESIVETLVAKLFRAIDLHDAKNVYLVGGVSANSRLKEVLTQKLKDRGIHYLTPTSLAYCGDNAAMVGITAWHKHFRDL